MPKTLYDKIWDAHLVHEAPDGTCLLYIDRHLVHEVTSPQAFEGLRMAGRRVRAPEKTVAVPDHNVPTDVDRARGIENEESRSRSTRCGRTPGSSASSSTTSPTSGRGSSISSGRSRG